MPEIQRKPRKVSGGKLAVLKIDDRWHVLYVSEVTNLGTVWHLTVRGATTNRHSGGVEPFTTWHDAMAHAATLRTYYGDQCRGDNLLWNRRHGRGAA